jgi:hypothetical protein
MLNTDFLLEWMNADVFQRLNLIDLLLLYLACEPGRTSVSWFAQVSFAWFNTAVTAGHTVVAGHLREVEQG